MSALASGFNDAKNHYTVIAPLPMDLGGPFKGCYYIQKTDICWVSNRAYEYWAIRSIKNNKITIQPLKARYNNGIRIINDEILKKEYIKVQYQNKC